MPALPLPSVNPEGFLCKRGGANFRPLSISTDSDIKQHQRKSCPRAALIGRVSYRHKRLQKRNREGAKRVPTELEEKERKTDVISNQQRKGKKCFAAKSDKTIEN